MKPESSATRRVIIGTVVLFTVCVVALVITGLTSLISLADRIHPVAGNVAFWTIALAAAFFALYAVIAYAKLPAALIPPEETSGPNHEEYLEALRVRLAANPRTRGLSLATEEEIERAMAELKKLAPAAGSYVAESNYFETDWQKSYWGSNYPRLLAIKQTYDPQGLFFARHGVGSEAWSDDGFSRTIPG